MAAIPKYDNLQEVIAKMTNYDNFRLAPRIATMAEKALLQPNQRIKQALAHSTESGLPPIHLLPLAWQHLAVLAQIMGAKTVLEIGTLGGVGSIALASTGAAVTSIEIDPHHRQVALDNVRDLERGSVDVLLGDAGVVLPQLAAEGRRFDLVVIDANMDHMWEHFDGAVRVTRPGGAIFFDDVVAQLIKDDAIDDPENIVAKVGHDERVEATLVPTVIAHPALPGPGLNGYLLVHVKDRV